MTRAQKIEKALEEMTMCCERIKEYRKCAVCPLAVNCLDEEPFLDVAYNAPVEKIAEFIEMAENLTDEMTREEWEAEQANLRRCDPDDF